MAETSVSGLNFQTRIGWCILAYIVVLIRSSHSGTPIRITLGGVVGFALLMIYSVQRALKGFAISFEKRGELSENMVAFVLVLALGSALCTEALGIHLLFGSFLMGAIMPKEQKFVATFSTGSKR